MVRPLEESSALRGPGARFGGLIAADDAFFSELQQGGDSKPRERHLQRPYAPLAGFEGLVEAQVAVAVPMPEGERHTQPRLAALGVLVLVVVIVVVIVGMAGMVSVVVSFPQVHGIYL